MIMSRPSHYLTLPVYAVKFKSELTDPKKRPASLRVIKISSLILFSIGVGYVYFFINLLFWGNDPDVHRIAIRSILLHAISIGITTLIALISFIYQLHVYGVF